LFLPYRQFHHYHHGLRMWYNYLRCLYPFLEIEVGLCFKFDLREALDIRNFLKETTSALKLRFDCSTIKLRKSISKIQFNGMSKVDWFHFTLLHFSVNIWDTLIWAHWWPYWAYWPSHLSTAICSESIQEVRECILEYFLQRYSKDCARKPLQTTNLLHIRLELRGLNYQTPFYADCILK
jgi:hypothetical protein